MAEIITPTIFPGEYQGGAKGHVLARTHDIYYDPAGREADADKFVQRNYLDNIIKALLAKTGIDLATDLNNSGELTSSTSIPELIQELIQALGQTLHIVGVHDSLDDPELSTVTQGAIAFILKESDPEAGVNIYDEYVYVTDTNNSNHWELLGRFSSLQDLSNYLQMTVHPQGSSIELSSASGESVEVYTKDKIDTMHSGLSNTYVTKTTMRGLTILQIGSTNNYKLVIPQI